jgi:hypothetical protein
MVQRRVVYRVLVEKFEGKLPLWRHRHRWKYNIKMYLLGSEICGGVWIGSIWLKIGTVGGNLCWEFLDRLRTGYLVKKDSPVWSV